MLILSFLYSWSCRFISTSQQRFERSCQILLAILFDVNQLAWRILLQEGKIDPVPRQSLGEHFPWWVKDWKNLPLQPSTTTALELEFVFCLMLIISRCSPEFPFYKNWDTVFFRVIHDFVKYIILDIITLKCVIPILSVIISYSTVSPLSCFTWIISHFLLPINEIMRTCF